MCACMHAGYVVGMGVCCDAKILPGENCTTLYNFRCEKCTGLAKSVLGIVRKDR